MELKGRNLKRGSVGADVLLLQFELTLLGLDPAEEEIRASRFGPSTEEGVKKVQSRARLNQTGVVEAGTAKAINTFVRENVPGDEAADRLLEALKLVLEAIFALDPAQADIETEIERLTTALDGLGLARNAVQALDPPDELIAETDHLLNQGRARLKEVQDALNNRPAQMTYAVSGYVAQRDGEPVANAPLRLIEKRIITAQNQTLGTTTTAADGSYRIEYAQMEGAAPDIVLELLDKPGGNLVTRSPLIVDAPPRQAIDLIVDDAAFPPASEFDQIARQIGPLVGDTPIGQLDSDSISYLSGRTGISPLRLSKFVQAHAFAQNRASDVPPQTYYGLFRANLPINKPALVAQDNAALSKALSVTSANNVIDPRLSRNPKEIERLVDQINRDQVASLLDPTPLANSSATIGTFLDIAALQNDQKQIVVQTLQSTPAVERGETFWKNLSEQGIDDRGIESLQLTARLGTLTLNNAPLMQTLHGRLAEQIGSGQDPLRGLVDVDEAEWLTLIQNHTNEAGEAIIPDGIKAAMQDGQSAEDLYARTLARQVEESFPTATLVARANGSATLAPVAAFLNDRPDFEYRENSVTAYIRANRLDIEPEAQASLEQVGRLFELAPRFERNRVVDPLIEADIRSAYQIRTMGQTAFLSRFSGPLGAAEAQQVYAKAAQKTAIATSLFSQYAAPFHNLELYAIPGFNPGGAFGQIIPQPEQIDFPTWETLFGSLDFCDCDHCNSVYSPAAYLVALLKFLHDNGALNTLMARRPDIGHVELNCHNTNTTLPYIDIVLEVFETFLVEGVAANETYQIIGEAPALRVHPEYINAEAYRILAEDQVYPWSLPFDLWTAEARAYLGPLDTDRHTLIDRLHSVPRPDRTSADWLPWAVELLGIGPGMPDILFDNTFRLARWNGQNLAALRTVQTLLDTARISFLELRQLIDTRFVDPNDLLSINFTVGEGEDAKLVCDLEEARIEGLTTTHLNRLQRFVRLQRQIGWTIHELDVVLAALGGVLNDINLIRLAGIEQLHRQTETDRPVIASWFGNLDTLDYLNDDDEISRSLYASLFLNKTVGTDEDLAPFELGALDGSGSIDDHDAAILAALQIITAEELTAIKERRLPNRDLTLENLSILHRVATLKRALKLSAIGLLDLLDLSGLDPFDSIRQALDLFDLVALFDRLDITVPEANYLLHHALEANSPVAPTEASLVTFLDRLRADLLKINADFSAQPDPTGEITGQMLAILLAADLLPSALDIIYGVAPPTDLPADPSAFLDEHLALFMPDSAERATVISRLVDPTHSDYLTPEVDQAARFALILEPLAVYLRNLTSQTLMLQQVADFIALDLDPTGLLLNELIQSTADPAQTAATLFLDPPFVESDIEIDPANFPNQFSMLNRLHKITYLIDRFDLPTDELEWLVAEHAVVGWLDLNALPVAETADAGDRWLPFYHMAQAARLRRDWPAGEPTLFTLLRDAETGGDATAFSDFLDSLAERTGWSRTDIDTLLDSARFNFNSFAAWGGSNTLTHLIRLAAAFEQLRRLGVSAEMAWSWTATTVTQTMASEVKQAARAKFNETAWLAVAEPIRDQLRQKQRDVLVEAILQALADPNIKDTNDLYARFLMDAEMNPCMSTSRIVFATASAQLFVQRILLNLEPDVSFNTEQAEMWDWMKNYRVWEANVKVFVTPENWIEPELRIEKSPLFVDLENELLQNDVTLETAELAYQNYLEKLDEIARLEVVGVYNEEETQTLHIVGRTKGTPYKYFYRQWFEARRWTPWQEITVDIEGETVMPVIYNRRLYLFWFMTMIKALEETDEDGDKPQRYVEIKLAWSQYRQRKWSPKRISNVVVNSTKTRNESDDRFLPGAFRPRPEIQSDGNLTIYVERMYSDGSYSYLDSVTLESPKTFLFINDGQVVLANQSGDHNSISPPVYQNFAWSNFYRGVGGGSLQLRGEDNSWQTVLDEVPTGHKVTLPLQNIYFKSGAPFFFEDRHRTYFIVPNHKYGPVFDYTGPLVADFPYVEVYIDDDIPTHIPDFVGPIGPIDPRAPFVQPGLGSLINPAINPVPVDVVTTDVINTTGGTSLVTPSTPLTTFQGGPAVIGGAVGVPITGSLTELGLVSGDAPLVGQFGPRSAAVNSRAAAIQATGSIVQADQTINAYATEEIAAADVAMGVAVTDAAWGVVATEYKHTLYTFYSFYHPYVDFLIRQLNRHGVDGILNPQENEDAHSLRRQQTVESPADAFTAVYDVGNRADSSAYPKEEFDFEYGRAYSIYNWELFFHIPFMIANHLSQNRRFDEAQQWYHTIFDPTDRSDLPAADLPYRFWKIKPFYENRDIQTIEQLLSLLSSSDPADLAMKQQLEAQIEDWRRNPFQPHLIAEQRPVAYQKAIVMKYLDNLIAWGDMLFRQDTRESVFESIQLYLLAAEILGKEPEKIPAPDAERTIDGNPVRTFNDLQPHLDAFGNVLVQLETELGGGTSSLILSNDLVTPNAGNPLQPQSAPSPSFAIEPSVHDIIGSTLFFCIPPNPKLLGYWDTVADRLFKIRNCQNIEGVFRSLDLFAPPIDPALLVRAAAAGLDLGSVLNDLNAPRPHYRFTVMISKAIEFCNDVKGLGSALLQALEKKDAEELTLLRQTHEQTLLKAVKQIREQQVDEAKESLDGLKKNLESAEARQKFYANRNRLIPNEKLHLDKMESAALFESIAQATSLIGSFLALIPEFDLGAEGGFSSPTVKVQFGGANLAKVIDFVAQYMNFIASLERHAANRAQVIAGYDRRQEEWDFSAEQAAIEIEGLEHQITAGEIRIAIAENELSNQTLQIEQSAEIDDFMRYKFTNKELYSWMVTQTSTLYFQAYQLAYDMAKRVERAFQHELADYSASFINFGYWDSLRKGLLAGERLQLDLRRMESAYYERNKRELELTKQISLRMIDPAALIQLQESGSCEFEVSEALFNLDFPGHHLRRLKMVSLTIPAVTGPYSGMHATLTLLTNRIRVSTTDPQDPYIGIDDTRFVTNIGGIQAIATSSGQNDSGLFEPNLQDSRYLPFEGAGAIGRWRIELNGDYPHFDFDTISDVVLHLRYTARDGGLAVRQPVVTALNDRINELVNRTAHTGLYRFVSLKREQGSALHRFLNPEGTDDHAVTFSLLKDHYPYFLNRQTLTIDRAILLVDLADPTLYDDGQPLAIELERSGGGLTAQTLLTSNNPLGGLPNATYDHLTGEIDTTEDWQLHITPTAVAALPDGLKQTVTVDSTDVNRLIPEQIKDIGLLIHYTLG